MSEKYVITKELRDKLINFLKCDRDGWSEELAEIRNLPEQTVIIPSEMELMLVLDHTVRIDDIGFEDDDEAVRACEVFSKVLHTYLTTPNTHSKQIHEAQVFFESKIQDAIDREHVRIITSRQDLINEIDERFGVDQMGRVVAVPGDIADFILTIGYPET